ncbi:hypothetical protein PSQ39_06395 [Curvibacter sp. HBC28]|uniref:Uncharacterized protein n=1 Tax=Curvibacter microcysteis TaxID=3026419 RepID=A0ABT5MD00_9BURK|nr:hypothetical protein [Curvibacter sp. HBC28]MDD0814255.1 hypothetical protein [Curvibacter sp. HBC28]
MSATTKSKPVTASVVGPTVAPANEAAFGGGGNKPPTECFMTMDEYDKIHAALYRAEAVVRCLVHVFGGDANIKDPTHVNGLFGSLQAAVKLMAGVNTMVQYHSETPDQLRLNVEQALSLLQLIEHLQIADDYEWRWSQDWYCAYFDAACSNIESAMTAMTNQVNIRKAAA